MKECGYASPSDSEVEWEGLLPRTEEEREDIPQWTKDVIGRTQDVERYLLAIASCPIFHMDFKFNEMQSGPPHLKRTVPCMCPFSKHARHFLAMLPDYTTRTFLFDEKCDANSQYILNNKHGLLSHCKNLRDWKHDMVIYYFNELYKPSRIITNNER